MTRNKYDKPRKSQADLDEILVAQIIQSERALIANARAEGRTTKIALTVKGKMEVILPRVL